MRVRLIVSVNLRNECERKYEYKFLVASLDLKIAENKRATVAEPCRSNFLIPQKLNLSFVLNHPFEYPKMVASVKHFLALAIFAVLASTGKNVW